LTERKSNNNPQKKAANKRNPKVGGKRRSGLFFIARGSSEQSLQSESEILERARVEQESEQRSVFDRWLRNSELAGCIP